MPQYQNSHDPSGGSSPGPLTRLTDVAAGVAHLLAETGEVWEPFSDAPWVRSCPAGHIDLFQWYSDRTGVSIGLRESVLVAPPLAPIGVYFLRPATVGPFVRFLAETAIRLPGGRFARPVHLPPGRLPAGCHHKVRDAIEGCHLIFGHVTNARPSGSPRSPRPRGRRSVRHGTRMGER